MTTVRVCLILVVFISVCTDYVPGQPIFWSLLDYIDDSNSTSTEDDDYDVFCDWVWSCNRKTTTARTTVMPTTELMPRMQGHGPMSMNISWANGSFMLTMNGVPAPAPSSPGAPAAAPSSPGGPAPAPSSPSPTPAASTPSGSVTAAPTAATTTAATTTTTTAATTTTTAATTTAAGK